MSRTHSADPSFVHIPPPPARSARRGTRRSAADAVLATLREASLAGIAALGFAWGLAELAFVLLSR